MNDPKTFTFITKWWAVLILAIRWRHISHQSHRTQKSEKWCKNNLCILLTSLLSMHTLFKKKWIKIDALSFAINLMEQIVDRYGSEVEFAVKRRFGCPSLEGNLFVWQIDTAQTLLSQPKVKAIQLRGVLFAIHTKLKRNSIWM